MPMALASQPGSLASLASALARSAAASAASDLSNALDTILGRAGDLEAAEWRERVERLGVAELPLGEPAGTRA